MRCTNYTGNTTSKTFIEFVEELGKKYKEFGIPVTLIIDNASIHTSKEVKEKEEDFKKLGVTLYKLPPYSPELNRIEKIWYQIKHVWLPKKGRSVKELHDDVVTILEGFGNQYHFSVRV